MQHKEHLTYLHTTESLPLQPKLVTLLMHNKHNAEQLKFDF